MSKPPSPKQLAARAKFVDGVKARATAKKLFGATPLSTRKPDDTGSYHRRKKI